MAEQSGQVSSAAAGARYRLLPFAADTPALLDRLIMEAMTAGDLASLAEDCWAKASEAQHLSSRAVYLADSLRMLGDLVRRDNSEYSYVKQTAPSPHSRTVAMLIAGLGQRPIAAGRPLYLTHAMFRDEVDALARPLLSEFGIDLRPYLTTGERVSSAGSDWHRLFSASSGLSRVDAGRTIVDQPTQFVIGYALARTWISAGVRPQVIVGHSLGEYVAACLAGVFTPLDALRIVARRAMLIATLPPGGMLAVSLPPDELRSCLDGDVVIAATNSPSVTVVSGLAGELQRLMSRLDDLEVPYRNLDVSHSFHSPLLGTVSARFRSAVEQTPMRPASGRWISTVTGTWIRPAQPADPGYWVRHMCGPVRFAESIRTLLRLRSPVLLEVGTSRSLATLANHTALATSGRIMPAFASIESSAPWRCDTASWLFTFGRLWAEGAEVRWDQVADYIC